MINIKIKTVKPGSLKFNRVGDWHWEGDKLNILVQEMKDERYEWLIAHHEQTEATLCRINGVKEEDIDKFDEEHEGKWIPSGPGYKEHIIATGHECLLAAAMGVNWGEYEKAVISSSEKYQEETTGL